MSFVHQPGGAGAGAPRSGGGWSGLLCQIIRGWALVGAAIITVLVLVTAAGAISNLVAGRPFMGEYELAKHLVGIAVFTFLPYCQLTRANVTVDIFTARMGRRARAAMAFLSSLLALAFALLLLRQMSLGFGDYLQYPEVTPTLHLPLWTAFPPILLSLLLLAAAAAITAFEAWREATGGPVAPDPSR